MLFFCVGSLEACANGAVDPFAESSIPTSVAAVTWTTEFDDAPLQGEVRILPIADGPLRYSVDFDGDGRSEESGELGAGVSILYRYDDVGPHVIRVIVEDGDRMYIARRTVVVPDTTVFEMSRSAGRSVAGLVLDPAGTTLYVTFPGDDRIEALGVPAFIHRWDAIVDMAPDRSAGGLDLSRDGSRLFIDRGDSLVAVALSDRAVSNGLAPAMLGAGVWTLVDGTVLVGGETGLARVDPADGSMRALYEKSIIAVTTGNDRVAVISREFGHTINILDDQDLEVLWSASFEAPVLYDAVPGFSADGRTVYAVIRQSSGAFFHAWDALDGSPLRALRLTPPDRTSSVPAGTRRAAVSRDGLYVVLATEIGAILVDTRTHLPVGRAGPHYSVGGFGCCNVSSEDPLGYFHFTSAGLTRARLNPPGADP